MFVDLIDGKMAHLQEHDLRRHRHVINTSKDGIIEVQGQHYINFASNDYLGLSQHEQVLQAYVEGLAVYGSGSGASPLVTGYGVEHKALEDDICEILDKQAAILFSSGFAANQAICHALFPKKGSNATLANGGRIICDKLMHASFIEGALSSSAKLSRFAHNNIDHAQQLLARDGGDTLVATEGVFSMDGDLGKINELIQLVKRAPKDKQAWIVLDEAHAIGVMGERGFGSLDYKNVNAHEVDIVMGTFGKALGTSGAFVAGTRQFIEFLINTSKHYIYSTAISAAQARATRVALSLVELGKERETLHHNIEFFKALAKQRGITLLPSTSAIQPLVLGEATLALACAQKLQQLGLWVPAIRTPTVAKGTDRLRITLSALHSEKDIEALIDGLSLVLSNIPKRSQDNSLC